MAAEFDNRLPSDQLYQDPTRWVDLDAGDEARDPNNKFFLLTPFSVGSGAVRQPERAGAHAW